MSSYGDVWRLCSYLGQKSRIVQGPRFEISVIAVRYRWDIGFYIIIYIFINKLYFNKYINVLIVFTYISYAYVTKFTLYVVLIKFWSTFFYPIIECFCLFTCFNSSWRVFVQGNSKFKDYGCPVLTLEGLSCKWMKSQET